MRILFALILSLTGNSTIQMKQPYTLLALGDSYTVGESVEERERFPMQSVELLRQQNFCFAKPEMIARTGWTTDELAEAIRERNLRSTYDFVTLLIGVNNQYRQRDLENYRSEFRALLSTAIEYANGNCAHVFVISIPDWGATHFVAQDAHHRSAQQIGEEIERFNAIGNEEAQRARVHYIDITQHSRLAKHDDALIAGDGLHPSGRMYSHWAQKLAQGIAAQLK